MIHVITGDGKGKTTAAVGLSVRVAGRGHPVLIIQFLKGDDSGEIRLLKDMPGINILHAPNNYGFTFQMSEEEFRETAEDYDKLLEIALRADSFLIVLDEVIHALNTGLVKKEKIEMVLEKKSEIVLTGRDAPEWLIERADYVSDIKKIKHPYDKGILARAGIEY